MTVKFVTKKQVSFDIDNVQVFHMPHDPLLEDVLMKEALFYSPQEISKFQDERFEEEALALERAKEEAKKEKKKEKQARKQERRLKLQARRTARLQKQGKSTTSDKDSTACTSSNNSMTCSTATSSDDDEDDESDFPESQNNNNNNSSSIRGNQQQFWMGASSTSSSSEGEETPSHLSSRNSRDRENKSPTPPTSGSSPLRVSTASNSPSSSNNSNNSGKKSPKKSPRRLRLRKATPRQQPSQQQQQHVECPDFPPPLQASSSSSSSSSFNACNYNDSISLLHLPSLVQDDDDDDELLHNTHHDDIESAVATLRRPFLPSADNNHVDENQTKCKPQTSSSHTSLVASASCDATISCTGTTYAALQQQVQGWKYSALALLSLLVGSWVWFFAMSPIKTWVAWK